MTNFTCNLYIESKQFYLSCLISNIFADLKEEKNLPQCCHNKPYQKLKKHYILIIVETRVNSF